MVRRMARIRRGAATFSYSLALPRLKRSSQVSTLNHGPIAVEASSRLSQTPTSRPHGRFIWELYGGLDDGRIGADSVGKRDVGAGFNCEATIEGVRCIDQVKILGGFGFAPKPAAYVYP
ncbi:hypothetical protein AB1N83_003915 [Pleurotus pulmonarius]